MKRVLEYISQNYDKQLKLEEAAEQVFITPAYLGIIFKKRPGKISHHILRICEWKKQRNFCLM